jgi:hypothetical protein
MSSPARSRGRTQRCSDREAQAKLRRAEQFMAVARYLTSVSILNIGRYIPTRRPAPTATSSRKAGEGDHRRRAGVGHESRLVDGHVDLRPAERHVAAAAHGRPREPTRTGAPAGRSASPHAGPGRSPR